MLKQILINNSPKATQAETIAQLAEELELPERGVALAVNNIVVPRSSWNDTFIVDNDSITVIKAAFGG